MSGRHKYEKDRSYQAYQAEFEEFNSRFNGKTEIKKLSFEELEIDRQKMDKLIGYSSPPKKKLKSAKEVYQHDWREMHTSQDVLDYEQRMKKYKKKELQTPYEKDFYYLKKPETGYWPAKTPLYNEIHKKNKIVPEETERGAAPPRAPPPPPPRMVRALRLRFNTYVPQKRRDMRKFAARAAAGAVKTLKRATTRASRVTTDATMFAYGRMTTKAHAKENYKKKMLSLEAEDEAEKKRGPQKPLRLKRTFFALPGQRPKPKEAPRQGQDVVAHALKQSPGSRTTIAKRLFGRPSYAAKKPMALQVAPASSGSDPLGNLGSALVPRKSDDLIIVSD